MMMFGQAVTSVLLKTDSYVSVLMTSPSGSLARASLYSTYLIQHICFTAFIRMIFEDEAAGRPRVQTTISGSTYTNA